MSASSLAQAMEDALYLEGASTTLVKRGRERLNHFSWQRSASSLLALFDDVIDQQRGKSASTVRTLPTTREERPASPFRIAARIADAFAH